MACGDASVRPAAEPAARPSLVDVAAERGVVFRHRTGARGEFLLPEIMGGGAALFDHDADGDLDVYLTDAGPASKNRLFRQEGDGRFTDATRSSGLGFQGAGMGIAVGDIDNDGDPDVYLTNLGADRLYRNRGNGIFDDVTAAAGVEVDGWSCSAVFFDYDRDGYLDLYVTRYVRHDPAKRCTDAAGRPDYCNPSVFAPELDVLLRNNGDGTFADVSERAGILATVGAGLGVVAVDLNEDGWPDVYVANDGDPNVLWINRGDGTFRDEAMLRGVAYNLQGEAEAGMGVVAADLDRDLDLDLFMTHLFEESNTFYRNRGDALGYEDATAAGGLLTDSLPFTGFGIAALDIELDGDLDLAVANGRVTTGSPDPRSRLEVPWNLMAEPNRVYLNDGNGRFGAGGDAFSRFAGPPEISRAIAAGDIDGDGDIDLLMANIESEARLFLNQAPRAGSWLSIRAVDPRLKRDAIGARVVVHGEGGSLVRIVSRGGSYLASNDPRAHFGLGSIGNVDRVEVRWPDGPVESFPVRAVDRELTVERGKGTRR